VNRAGTETHLFVCRLSRPYPFASPVFGEEYAAWIISNDSVQTFIERESVATALVSTGCRFAVCSGYECPEWDDAIDWAFIHPSEDFDPPDEKFVMTSWHENESIQEVAEFFVRRTAFDNFIPSNFVLLAVGDDPLIALAEDAVRRLLAGEELHTK
jgi:hypothetical protein